MTNYSTDNWTLNNATNQEINYFMLEFVQINKCEEKKDCDLQMKMLQVEL